MSKRFFSRFKDHPDDILPLHLVASSGFVAGLGSGLIAVIDSLFRPLYSMQELESRSKKMKPPKSIMAQLKQLRRFFSSMVSEGYTLDSLQQ
jgi:hypothetical protein